MTTLGDAMEALAEAVAEIEEDPAAVEELLFQRLPMVYARLNYAWHSRELGPAAVERLDHDQLISFPKEFPFS
ncbi:MAG TPA: hypothetical protein PK261_02350 [Accumulibacter sp.]|nr:hypothetical protein [Accumulibacter sp.]HNH23805.1 hypothetical protein [Accumulibacter sp.]